MGIRERVEKLETELTPGLQPGTMAALVLCCRGDLEWRAFDWSAFAPLIEKARETPAGWPWGRS